MSSVTSSDITSSNQVRDENENYDLTVNKSEVPVVPLRRNGVKLIVKSNYLVEGSLKHAIRVGNIEQVKLLIRQGVDVNGSGRKGSSPLHVATKYGHVEIIELLINNGARLDPVFKGTMKYGFTPLHLACVSNNVKCVKVLLKYGASGTPKCDHVYHPIYFAVFKNYVEVAALLLENGADVNLRFNNKFFYNKWDQLTFWKDMDLTLLHYSIAREYDEMITLLLKHGADIHLKTRSNKTSLMHAVEISNPTLVESFLAKGANPNDRDINGKPVLFYIVVNANYDSIYYNKKEFYLDTLKLEIITLLYAAGADVNVKFQSNKSFDSLVHYACMYGHREILKFLLYKSNFDWRNIDYVAIEVSTFIEEALSPTDQRDLLFISRLKNSFSSERLLLLCYILSRHMIGFPVKEELLSAIHSSLNHGGSLEKYAEPMEFIKRDFENQIRDMKQTTIENTKISLWHILTCKMTDLVRLSFREDIWSICLSEYIHKMSDYYNIIDIRLKTAINRSILIEESREIVFDLFHTHLEYDCCEAIAISFNDRELEDFVNLCSNDIVCLVKFDFM